jgi:hypothetical protein
MLWKAKIAVLVRRGLWYGKEVKNLRPCLDTKPRIAYCTFFATGRVMETLIIYKLYHRMNTEKIAKVMAEALNAKLVKVEDIQPEELADYDLIGFGSGIYGYKHHQKLLELIEKMPPIDKKVFFLLPATYGRGIIRSSKRSLRKKAVKLSASSPASASLPAR